MQIPDIVHVVDDDEAVRHSLDFLLRSAQLGVRTYESAVAFLAALPTLRQGVVVTDVRMPELDGVELVRRTKASGIDLPVIVITGHGDIKLAVEAMKAGAVDFLEKPFDDEVLLASIRSAVAGRAAPVVDDTVTRDLQNRLRGLSAREAEVLAGLIEGKPNKTIAFDLGISPRTVEIYRANLMTKMQARSLAELIRMTLSAQPTSK
jgi:two-component system, LuxR family, response regulator FixJ